MKKQKCLIIAEAGVNHNGSVDIAKKLIDAASAAGVDYIKFQTFISELSISKKALRADYQKKNTKNSEESQFEMVKKLELDFKEFEILNQYCRYKKIGFLSTGFDTPSIDFLDDIGIPFFKIPSGELTNKPYLQHIAKKNKPILLSTGMSSISEVKQALDVLIEAGLKRKQITVLHCNTEYPTPFEDVNLLAMITLSNEFGVDIGYSDHTIGIVVPIAAVALGARVIEKHFTLDRNMEGPDHKASIEPSELKDMVKAIRNVELAISGDGLKKPSKSELKNIPIARKSIHLAKKISKGEPITFDHLIMKRPGDGISPMEIDKVVGKKAYIDIDEETKLTWEMLED